MLVFLQMLQNSPVPRTVDRQTEKLDFTWESSSIKIWLEAMGKRNVLKNEKKQNEKLPARALRSWQLTKAVSYYHITPHLLPSWSFSMPSITRQLSCVTAFQSLPGVSHLKVSNSEDLSWVDMNLVTRKSSKLGGHKCYKREEHILKLVKKEKMDQEPGNSCPSARNTFLITTPYSLPLLPFPILT